MGRGLSELQKTVLQLAAENVAGGTLNEAEVHLYTYEVMWKVYHFDEFGKNFHAHDYTNKGHVHRSPGTHHFDVAAIGAERYQAASAAISRTFKRLQERGLAERYNGSIAWWSGIKLTDEGLALAQSLTVKS